MEAVEQVAHLLHPVQEVLRSDLEVLQPDEKHRNRLQPVQHVQLEQPDQKMEVLQLEQPDQDRLQPVQHVQLEQPVQPVKMLWPEVEVL